jgi:transposase, IS5 family
MRPKKHKTTGSSDLFRARLDQIINLKHELVQLAGKLDWDWIDGEIAPLYSENGRPGIEIRFMIGLLLLKHIYGLSDEGVCERWVHDPYFQYFTGEGFFQHAFPHERSDLSHWRKRLGDMLELLLAESLRVAHDTSALRSKDLKRVTGRHHGAAEGDHLPDRCQAAARGDQGSHSTAWRPGTASGCGNPICGSPRPRR